MLRGGHTVPACTQCTLEELRLLMKSSGPVFDYPSECLVLRSMCGISAVRGEMFVLVSYVDGSAEIQLSKVSGRLAYQHGVSREPRLSDGETGYYVGGLYYASEVRE
jgi:hypothetical protein